MVEANAARKENRFKDAKQGIDLALKIARRIFDTKLLAKSLNDLARIERDLGNAASSIAHYKELVVLHEKHTNKLEEPTH